MITVNGKNYITLNEPIFVNDKRVLQVYANNVLVYPDEYPASIKIINNPTKTQYASGERIDLTGISVQAYKADGSVWQNSKYLNGIIPLSELMCEPSTISAQSINSNAEYAGDSDTYGPIFISSNESEMVFIKKDYTPRITQKWTLKFTPTNGGCYTVIYNPTGRGSYLTVVFVTCGKVDGFDGRLYPLEISWNCEFFVSPGYSDGSESGTKLVGYGIQHFRTYYYRESWFETDETITSSGGWDYVNASSISYNKIPYTRRTRPRNYFALDGLEDNFEYMDKESTTTPIVTQNANYLVGLDAMGVMGNYWGQRLTSGIKKSLSTVAVKWRRPGDNQELTANYNITVMSPVPT